MKPNIRTIALALAFGNVFGCGISVAKDAEPQTETQTVKTDYRFRQPNTPVRIAPNNTVVYSMSPVTVATMRGDVLFSTKKNLLSLNVIPSGVNFVVIEKDKKGRNTATIAPPKPTRS